MRDTAVIVTVVARWSDERAMLALPAGGVVSAEIPPELRDVVDVGLEFRVRVGSGTRSVTEWIGLREPAASQPA